ncbi:hypothetical protein [Paracoccus sp. MKU1]|uniref:hypothetical protein n=1 Tax=Paracoccus sp. MKU1 TaxID=1745182 RepID=UPI0007191283|nr:hypothetical protein [Paracoccus sp. MKU1]KRW96958.1 hypothetical protein AQY21_06280 [Paracoccus sp. MKU1]
MHDEHGRADAARNVASPERRCVDRTERQLSRHYLEAQYVFVQFFTEHLADCNEAFGNDLGEMLVLAVLGQRRLHAALQPSQDDEDETRRACMSASRIADVARMPRQTVRRKLASLHAKGWIENDPAHGWHIPHPDSHSPARDGLRGLEQRGYARLARLYTQLGLLLETARDEDAEGDPACSK